MRRVLAAALATAAVLVLPATARAAESSRECGGVLDVDCTGYFCRMDCWYGECLLWVDPLHNPHSALCL